MLTDNRELISNQDQQEILSNFDLVEQQSWREEKHNIITVYKLITIENAYNDVKEVISSHLDKIIA